MNLLREINYSFRYANLKKTVTGLKENLYYLESRHDDDILSLDVNEIIKIEENALQTMELCKAMLGQMHDKEVNNIRRSNLTTSELETVLKARNNNAKNVILKNLPVEVRYQNNILEVKTPFIFQKAYKNKYAYQSYLVGDFVGLAIQKWIEEHGKHEKFFEGFSDFLYKSDKRIVIKIVRKQVNYSHYNTTDNDNIEAGRIINSICSAIGINDMACTTDLYCCWEKCETNEEAGTYFYIGTRRDILINDTNDKRISIEKFDDEAFEKFRESNLIDSSIDINANRFETNTQKQIEQIPEEFEQIPKAKNKKKKQNSMFHD